MRAVELEELRPECSRVPDHVQDVLQDRLQMQGEHGGTLSSGKSISWCPFFYLKKKIRLRNWDYVEYNKKLCVWIIL